MRNALKEILGKRIAGVVAKKRKEKNPSYQIFLIFSDRTNIEFYVDGNEIKTTSTLSKGSLKEVREYGGEESIVFEAFDDSILKKAKKTVRSRKKNGGGS